MAGDGKALGYVDNEEVTIRSDLIRNWRARDALLAREIARMEDQLRNARAERADIQASLGFVEKIKSREAGSGKTVPSVVRRPQARTSVSDSLTVGAAVLQALRASQREMRPREIRDWLVGANYRRDFDQKYFYTVLKRLVDSHFVTKSSMGTYAAAQNGHASASHIKSAPEA